MFTQGMMQSATRNMENIGRDTATSFHIALFQEFGDSTFENRSIRQDEMKFFKFVCLVVLKMQV